MQRGQALYLIRTSLLTLNDANKSGNYTVLRDLAAPAFRDANTSADLAGVFADIRKRRFDLFSVAVIEPELTAPPTIGANGLLRLTGRFNTQPLLITFDLLFQIVDGQWRLFGISVQTPPAAQPKASMPSFAPAMDQVPPPMNAPVEWAPPPPQ